MLGAISNISAQVARIAKTTICRAYRWVTEQRAIDEYGGAYGEVLSGQYPAQQ